MSWDVVELGAICEIINGSTPLRTNPEFWKNGQINWFTIEDIRRFGRVINQTTQFVTDKAVNETSLKIVPPNTVLLCCTASVGEFAIAKIPLTMNQQFNGLALKTDSVLPEFLFHYCSTLKQKLLSVSGSTTINFVAISKLKKITIPVPPLSTQQKIVAKLDSIFAEIDKATAAAEANAKNAEALFQSYLLDIFHNDNPNFISKRIDEIAEVFSGSGFPVNQQGLLNEEIPFYKVSDMNLVGNERHMISHNNSISRENAKQLGAKIIPAKSIIFPKIGGAIATNKKRILSVPSCVDNNVMAIFPDDNSVKPEFFFHLLSSIELSSFANEAALPSIKKSTVEERLVKIPKSLREQERICQLIESLKENSYKLKDSYFKKLNSLSLLKESILRQAFAGELVKE